MYAPSRRKAGPLRGVEDLDGLELGACRLEPPAGAVAVGALLVQPLEQQFVRFRDRIGRRAQDAVGDLLGRPERDDQVVHQVLGLARVVRREVAHVDVERDSGALRPGVQRNVRLGQQHCASDAAGLALPVWKREELLGDQGQSRFGDRLAAERGEAFRVDEQFTFATAAEDVRSEMQSLHSVPTQCQSTTRQRKGPAGRALVGQRAGQRARRVRGAAHPPHIAGASVRPHRTGPAMQPAR
jgi:hypothetical protein